MILVEEWWHTNSGHHVLTREQEHSTCTVDNHGKLTSCAACDCCTVGAHWAHQAESMFSWCSKLTPWMFSTFSLAWVAWNPFEVTLFECKNRIHLKSASYAHMYKFSLIYSAFLQQAAWNMVPINLQSPMEYPNISTCQILQMWLFEIISTAYMAWFELGIMSGPLYMYNWAQKRVHILHIMFRHVTFWDEPVAVLLGNIPYATALHHSQFCVFSFGV